MSQGRLPTRHRIGPPVVRSSPQRAVISLPLAIESYATVDGVECVLSSYARHLYRLELIGADWKIATLNAVYERDEIIPALPGQAVRIDPAELDGLRAPYRLLAWNLQRNGYEVSQDLPADDRPDDVARLYAEAFTWAGLPHP